ncbi:hypothetical protein [Rhodococcus sp. JVH1]|uniref:hypothetical protein n=1 Tax=Rhodococcus sp. JVH1 TaxID=745408 RepID=UPI00027207E0|nr:hypothetical protein [Rhodococcus sp. JVH1]EJJ01005.1 hypothetical protein JVH1_1631 [Rhodococcus sp. JVH1]
MICSRQGCTNQATRRGWCKSHYETWRKRQHLYGRFDSAYVDATAVRAHVAALQAAGMSERTIARLADVNRSQLSALIRGRSGQGIPPSRKVSTSFRDSVLGVPVPHAAFTVAEGSTRVDATGSMRRLQALVAAGWTQDVLAARLEMVPGNFGRLILGHRSRCTAQRAKDVAALFAELQLIPGPSDASRRRASRLGWALPMEWDEDTIDDPAAEPIRAAWTSASARAERIEQVAELTSRGHAAHEIAERLGISQRQVVRDRAVAS